MFCLILGPIPVGFLGTRLLWIFSVISVRFDKRTETFIALRITIFMGNENKIVFLKINKVTIKMNPKANLRLVN